MPIAVNGMKLCNTCREHKEASVIFFGPDKNKRDGLTTQCKSCRSYRTRRCSFRGICAELLSRAKKRAREKGLKFSLPQDFVSARLLNGKCELTGWNLKIDGKPFDFYLPSLDRIDSSQGYVPENVRMVCWGVNNMLGTHGLRRLMEVAEAVRLGRT